MAGMKRDMFGRNDAGLEGPGGPGGGGAVRGEVSPDPLGRMGTTGITVSDRSLRRTLLVQLVVLLITLSLVTGVAVAANLRRRERDGIDGPVAGVGPASVMHDARWRVRPLAIVHRGDDSAPENSLHAIANAGARGADYSEIDVRLTRDGVPVVFHDGRTGRLSAAGVDVPVSSVTLAELQRMPMTQHGEIYHIPTLAEAIGAARRSSDHLGLLLHLKSNPRHPAKLDDAVMDQVEDQRFADRAMFMSTNDEDIAIVHRRHPGWTVGKCVSPKGRPLVEWPKDASFVVMRGDRINLAVLARARRDGVPVFAGVSDDYREGNECLRLGADGILGGNTRRTLGTVDRHTVTLNGAKGGSIPWYPGVGR
ncbi:hypothetical protein JS528_09755 [Bifidobacterium sp. MA2]|uniref:GP-PDE domain-containing protein n=1 Tax=Bifidobacterium santillanense TaxID=2809028 RepID=A0ABS5URL9_9BIFI|nr:glycerophosphodiester phosphodiesterase family protein [Bifidobacterium santillanense]MBT1173617.1 hypothetical protein [Bifidobacterium santillanense]